MKVFFSLSTLLLSVVCMAQSSLMTGSIVGTLTDADQNSEPLPFATVVIKGTTNGSITNLEGKFKIDGLIPGTYTLVASFVGYEPTEKAGLLIEAGHSTAVSLSLGSNNIALEEVVVMAKAHKESEMALISVQRKSTDIKQSIGAQELSRKGVSTAEGAVTKVSGVSKQEGVKNVFVRGLGDRYNSTSLNGLPLPSEDPEYKNINLNFFGSDIINSVDVNKTFGTSLYGDVGGANINIVSKELFEDDELVVSLSTGVNGQVVGQNFIRIQGANYFGASETSPIRDLETYSFDNGFDPTIQGSAINSSFSIQGGKRFYLREKTLNALVIASSGSKYNFNEGIANSSLAANGGFGRMYDTKQYDYNAAQSLMGNFSLELNATDVITYNNLVIHNNSQSLGEYVGQAQNLSEVDGKSAFVRRQQINDNVLIVNQLLAEIQPTERIKLDLGAGLNIVKGNEPDRRTNTFIRDDATNTFEVAAGSAGLNHRFFSELDETEIVGKAIASYQLDANEESNNKISLGYNYRQTDRSFDYKQFSFSILGERPSIDINNVDEVFNQEAINTGVFEIVTNRGRAGNFSALTPDTYEGRRTIHAGFINVTYDLAPGLTVDGGLRLENVSQDVTWDFNQDRRRFYGDNLTSISKTYVLPSLNVRYLLNEDNIIRLAASQTYTMPQFKEVAPFLYEDIDFSSFGNPDLIPSDVYNLDIKFDHYFSRGELISLTGFYKQVKNSINRVLVESAATEMSYVNSGDADVMGLEMELRKTVWNISAEMYLEAGLNASYLFTKQQLVDTQFDDLQPRFTNSTSKLEGASPLLVNADLTFRKEGNRSSITSALIFNSFADRIYTIGTSGVNDIVNVNVPRLDWISKIGLSQRMSVGVGIKNLLNPSIKKVSKNASTGEQLLVSSFQRGTEFSLSLSYQLH